ncbi:hypothetical protein BC938DRAFT_470523 [Jimgerdemannia flammicorona]|uniref:Uncharacterized protein n=1 Tax=Jimgerdemannia flammicorona TaxID=994334 RepID=A0A433Q9Z7_9FUNG|nr:hypothetical protein BC938DRAFT_470523 [Jimgerdemannia flammicorona]
MPSLRQIFNKMLIMNQTKQQPHKSPPTSRQTKLAKMAWENLIPSIIQGEQRVSPPPATGSLANDVVMALTLGI